MIADIGPNFTYVMVALIGGLPSIISAVLAYLVHSKIKTPSGKSIGKQVEDVNHTTLSNNQHLGAISGKLGAEKPTAANGEAAKVEAPNPEGD